MHTVLQTLLVKLREGSVTSSRKQFGCYYLLLPMDLECPTEKTGYCVSYQCHISREEFLLV